MLTWKNARRVVVFIVGMTVLLFGIVLLFAPGPAFVVIPVGLAILATEFVWAERLLKRVKSGAQQMADKMRGKQANQEVDTPASKPGSSPGLDPREDGSISP